MNINLKFAWGNPSHWTPGPVLFISKLHYHNVGTHMKMQIYFKKVVTGACSGAGRGEKKSLLHTFEMICRNGNHIWLDQTYIWYGLLMPAVFNIVDLESGVFSCCSTHYLCHNSSNLKINRPYCCQTVISSCVCFMKLHECSCKNCQSSGWHF